MKQFNPLESRKSALCQVILNNYFTMSIPSVLEWGLFINCLNGQRNQLQVCDLWWFLFLFSSRRKAIKPNFTSGIEWKWTERTSNQKCKYGEICVYKFHIQWSRVIHLYCISLQVAVIFLRLWGVSSQSPFQIASKRYLMCPSFSLSNWIKKIQTNRWKFWILKIDKRTCWFSESKN